MDDQRVAIHQFDLGLFLHHFLILKVCILEQLAGFKLIDGIFKSKSDLGVHPCPFHCIGTLILGRIHDLFYPIKMGELPAADQLLVFDVGEDCCNCQQKRGDE